MTAPYTVPPPHAAEPVAHGLAEIIAKKTAEIEASGFAQWGYQSCRWCREGWGPPVESSIMPDIYVHPDSPVGRVKCGFQDHGGPPQ